MSQAVREQELLSLLEHFGDPRKTHRWPEGDPDYVAVLGLTPDDIPQLLHVTRQWIDCEDWPEDENDVSCYAPVHAWRSLAQLRAPQAIELLLGMIDPMDKREDDWHLEEFPQAFALIGPAALPALTAYLEQPGHTEFAHICAAHCLCELAKRHAQTRPQVVQTLGDTLARFTENDESLNAFLVAYLLELKATEAAPTIERAFAADRVDLSVAGNWDKVRDELGVTGEGLVPPELAGARPSWLLDPPASATPPRPTQTNIERNRRRAERKRQRQNRKRSRR